MRFRIGIRKETKCAKRIMFLGKILAGLLFFPGALRLLYSSDSSMEALSIFLERTVAAALTLLLFQIWASCVEARLQSQKAQLEVLQRSKKEDATPEAKSVSRAEPESKDSFHAAGRTYRHWMELLADSKNGNEGVTQDRYGRQLVYYFERFPCFDSFDYLYEDRYFRWFYIWYNGSWTQIYVSDDASGAEVTDGLSANDVMAHCQWRDTEALQRILADTERGVRIENNEPENPF